MFAKFSLVEFSIPSVDSGCVSIVAGKAPVLSDEVILSLLRVLAVPAITLPVEVVPPEEILSPVASSTN